MSSDPVGGNILFPPTLSRANLIATTLETMELTTEGFEVFLPGEDNFPLFANEGLPVETAYPPEQAVALLTQAESGIIKGKHSKIAETYWFEPPLASYPTVLLWVRNRAMYYEDHAEGVESFVQRWLHLCEQGHAIFGYISNFSFMYERDFLEEDVFPAVQRADVEHLVLDLDTCWLGYLGTDLAARWRETQGPVPNPCLLSQDLPSGAHFFRTATSVFD